ncbi:unnamed protein product [Brassica oleracea]|uniref:(rape) hypothetical protein n=1 Tax=Brassica napus TaxID=3708 RepID=A0A816J110_BRANA|nr:unnamed protein product [Brassica napus]
MFWAFSLLEDVILVFVSLDLASSDSLCGFFPFPYDSFP